MKSILFYYASEALQEAMDLPFLPIIKVEQIHDDGMFTTVRTHILQDVSDMYQENVSFKREVDERISNLDKVIDKSVSVKTE